MAIEKIPSLSPQEVAKQKIIQSIADSLPDYFKISEQPVYDKKTIYNMISQGRGPTIVSLRGQKYLEKTSFLEWLSEKSNLKRGRKRISAPLIW